MCARALSGGLRGLMKHKLRSSFYDPAGHVMEAVAFRKAYPARKHILMWPVLGVVVGTDFVGINHAASGGTPRIYETWVCAITPAGRVLVSSWWTGGLRRSVTMHGCVALAAALGGFVWWRFKAWRLVRAS